MGGEQGPHALCTPAGIQVLFAITLGMEVEKQ